MTVLARARGLIGAGLTGTGAIRLAAAAVLAGQLSVGWSNDAVDAHRDALAGRSDKPIATGEIGRRAVALAAAVAVLICLPLSLALGWRAGLLNLLMVAAAWAYNLWLKPTPGSALAYAVGFGLVPAFAATAAGARVQPWAVAAGALIGVGAHFANVLPDLDRDLATGVRGLPQRTARLPGGRFLVRLAALALLVAASGVIAFGPVGPPRAVGWAGFALALGVAAAGAVTSGRMPFRLAVAVAGIDVAMFVLRGPGGG
jgi:4-hydroxybenzoate polyprenyltransferase